MKKAILALMAILILGGGAGGAYYYFEHPAEASVGETEAHQEAKDEHGKEEHGGHQAFVELSPLILPVIDAEGVNQVVSLVVVIEVGNEKKADQVRLLEPRLKDAYIQELYGILNKHAAMKGGVIQIDMIKGKLAAISERVMGEGVVDEVLLQVVQQRPI